MRVLGWFANRHHTRAAVTMLLTGVLVGACGSADTGTSAQKETIKIAEPASLTGAAAFTGVPATQGFDLAIEELNKSARISNRKVELSKEDDATDPNQAITLVTRFVSDPSIIFIAGPTGSGTSVATAPIAQKAKVALMPIPAKAKNISPTGNYVFQVGAHPGVTEKAPLKVAVDDFSIKKAGIVFARDNAAQIGQKDIAIEYLKSRSVEISSAEPVSSTDTNFSSLIDKFIAAKVDAMYLPLYAEQSASFIVQAKQRSFPNATWIVTSTSVSNKFVEVGGKSVEGTLADADYNPDLDTDINRKFRAAYKAKYNKDPDNWAAVGYSAGLIVGAALEKLNGKVVTRDSFRDALNSVKDVKVVIGKGTFNFGSERDALYEGAIMTLKDGAFRGYQKR